MPFIGFLLVAFGSLVIALPALISYLIGGLLVAAGMQILLAYFAINRTSSSGSKAFRFGDYEIHRKPK